MTCVCLFVCLFVCSFVRLFVCLFVCCLFVAKISQKVLHRFSWKFVIISYSQNKLNSQKTLICNYYAKFTTSICNYCNLISLRMVWVSQITREKRWTVFVLGFKRLTQFRIRILCMLMLLYLLRGKVNLSS